MSEPKKYKNISVDVEIVEILNNLADELAVEFGFRPTISQTVRYLANLHKPDENAEKDKT